MSDQITTFNYETYNSGVSALAQQMMSATQGAMVQDTLTGKRSFWDQVGVSRLAQKTGRAVNIPIAEVPLARRSVVAKDYYGRDFVDEFDKLKILNDPTNPMTQSYAAAMARLQDFVAIDAALGTAYVGEEGTTPIVLPSTQKIAAGGTGFTLDKLQDAVERLKTRSAVMPGDEIHVWWTAKQEKAFINTAEVKSADYNSQKVMVNGALDSFYGCKFHRIEDIYYADSTAATAERILPKVSTTRSCVAWVKSGMRFGTWKAPSGRVDWIAERMAWQVSASLSIGATRMEEVKVVQIDVVES